MSANSSIRTEDELEKAMAAISGEELGQVDARNPRLLLGVASSVQNCSIAPCLVPVQKLRAIVSESLPPLVTGSSNRGL